MKTSEYILYRVNRLPKGYVFTYSSLKVEEQKKQAAIKALNRLADSGKIAKLAKGKFYKPEDTPFGKLKPCQSEILKDLLEENGKPTGYFSGFSIFSELGLTTQISNTIQIAKNQVRPGIKRDFYSIVFIKQKNIITKENIPFLQILDAIRFIKKIPDTNIETACRRFLAILRTFSDKDIVKIVRLSMKYPPATRALLGAMLEQLKKDEKTVELYNSLNPFTKYQLNGAVKVLNNAKRWNIS